ncbi:MAG: hypothetical protein B9S33_12655 [Pedosphaera sp. Tous-C6FEB]|nr:MAG: hypothetical protein B9S33_12655 [Pedosphaera sp. Tous-C6FEB]
MSSCTAFDLTPVVEWVENYFRERRLREVARQHAERLRAIMDRLRGLLPDAELFEKSLELTLKRADALEKSGDVGGAVVLLDAEIADLHNQIKLIEERLERRVTDLQRRFHALPTRASALRTGAARLDTFVKAAVATDWPAAERERLLAQAKAAQERIAVPVASAADLSAEGVRKLEDTEAQFTAAELALATAQAELEKELAATQKRLLSEKLGLPHARTVTIAEFLAQQPRSAAPANADEDRMAEKLEELLAKIGVLQDTAGWADLMRRADAVRAEDEAPRRRSLYEGLVLEASRRLKELRAVEQWLLGVDELLAHAAPFAGTAVDAIVAELRELRRAGRPVDLTPWRTRLAETQASERTRMERERKRQAVLESLAELGYETSEGMGTALVQAGKLVLHKPGEADYAVEVVTNRDLSLLQTEVIRFGETEAATEQERLRDQEQEVKWCSAHDALRDKLAQRGLTSNVKLHIPAGTKPVRVVKRDKAPAAARATAKSSAPNRA